MPALIVDRSRTTIMRDLNPLSVWVRSHRERPELWSADLRSWFDLVLLQRTAAQGAECGREALARYLTERSGYEIDEHAVRRVENWRPGGQRASVATTLPVINAFLLTRFLSLIGPNGSRFRLGPADLGLFVKVHEGEIDPFLALTAKQYQ